MSGEKNLDTLLKTLEPKLQEGVFVFCTLRDLEPINGESFLSIFKEEEGYTVILDKATADRKAISYNFIASWITLTVHSSLEAVGLTAAFSTALSDAGISCNVVAGYHHDHIFVNREHSKTAMEILVKLSR